jgi:serine protease AprX
MALRMSARTTARNRTSLALAAVAAAALVAAGVPATAAGAAPSAPAWREVVVTGPDAGAAAAAVRAAGGRLIADLPLVRGVAARLPAGAVLDPAFVVAPQRELRVAATGRPAAAPATEQADGTPAVTVRATLGLPADGDEGRGITVAVIDTGIADVPDLAGRVSDRVDVTGTGAGDGYGHGTFMAGLITGSGSGDAAYRGVAPAARLVDVKVADDEGITDLITVLRGLQWVGEHARGIDVLNLSLSSYSPLPYQVDPLTQGLEALWRRGITVVVPSGNNGPDEGSVTSPGSDPVLLTAGGLDPAGTATRGDDTVGAWSGRGPTWQGDAKPDLVAPGASVVSLRSAGSRIDTDNAHARIGEQYLRGSGTSMATAVTSGVVAAVLAENPRLRPDAVKRLLTGTVYGADGLGLRDGAGAGGLDAAAALAAAPDWRASAANRQDERDSAVLRGDARDWTAFERAVLAEDRAAAAAAWRALSPASREWAGRAWADLDPATREWAGRAWAGRAWASGPDGTAEEWTGRAWAGRAWAGRAWADADWTGRAWADADWTGRAWADADWAGRAWATGTWSGRAWAWMP